MLGRPFCLVSELGRYEFCKYGKEILDIVGTAFMLSAMLVDSKFRTA